MYTDHSGHSVSNDFDERNSSPLFSSHFGCSRNFHLQIESAKAKTFWRSERSLANQPQWNSPLNVRSTAQSMTGYVQLASKPPCKSWISHRIVKNVGKEKCDDREEGRGSMVLGFSMLSEPIQNVFGQISLLTNMRSCKNKVCRTNIKTYLLEEGWPRIYPNRQTARPDTENQTWYETKTGRKRYWYFSYWALINQPLFTRVSSSRCLKLLTKIIRDCIDGRAYLPGQPNWKEVARTKTCPCLNTVWKPHFPISRRPPAQQYGEVMSNLGKGSAQPNLGSARFWGLPGAVPGALELNHHGQKVF